MRVIPQESDARYGTYIGVNPEANVRSGVPSGGTSCLMASQYGDLG